MKIDLTNIMTELFTEQWTTGYGMANITFDQHHTKEALGYCKQVNSIINIGVALDF